MFDRSALLAFCPLAWEDATQTAGELVALLDGARGVVMVQLWAGWEPNNRQPCGLPYITDLLKEAAGGAARDPCLRACTLARLCPRKLFL